MISFIYYRTMSSFIKVDANILGWDQIDDCPFKGISDIPRMFLSILKSDVSYSWFAGGHAALAVLFSKLLRKRSIVILGGYEVAKLPEIGYGACLNRKYALIAKFALQHADIVLAVDQSLKDEAKENYGLSGNNIFIVPTCYDSEHFKPHGPKENMVLTVSPKSAYQRKGVPDFIEAARKLPNIKFVVIGEDGNYGGSPDNVEFPGYVSDEILLSYYQRAKVYCQLSLHEGLPNALCEAMLCECVPVGSMANGIPLAIGDTGFYSTGDIEKALKADGAKARQRIIELFSKRDLKKWIGY